MNAFAPLSAGEDDGSTLLERLCLLPGQVVQEFGWDDDTDEGLRLAIEARVGSPLEDEDYTGAADVALLWWRAEDGDLTDALVDLVVVLDEGGFVLLLTPKPGRAEAVEPADVDEAAETAGLHASASVSAAPNWRALRLVAPKTSKASARR